MGLLKSPPTTRLITTAILRDHLAGSAPRPLALPGLVDPSVWPALHTWTLEDGLSRLRELVGESREVDVELGPRGRGYMDERYKRVGMGFGLFLDAFILNSIPSTTPEHLRPTGYLAQWDIDPSSPLSNDLPALPQFKAGPRGEIWRRTLWIGPRGSWTPFHRDPYIGIYTHLIGRKTFWLLPPGAAGYLDVSPSAPHTNTSTIPISISAIFPQTPDSSHRMAAEATDEITVERLERYRDRLKRAFEVDDGSACEVDLEPGDSVLIPEGWWHSAEGLTTGAGVNAWFR